MVGILGAPLFRNVLSLVCVLFCPTWILRRLGRNYFLIVMFHMSNFANHRLKGLFLC